MMTYMNMGAYETVPIFIFKDIEKKYYLNISPPIEKTSYEYDKYREDPKDHKPIIKIVNKQLYDTYVAETETQDGIDIHFIYDNDREESLSIRKAI